MSDNCHVPHRGRHERMQLRRFILVSVLAGAFFAHAEPAWCFDPLAWLDHVNRAASASSSKDYRTAVEESRQSLAMARESGDRFYLRTSLQDLARDYCNLNQFQQSELQLKELLSVDADSDSLDDDLSELAYLYQKQHNLSSAETTYRKAIEFAAAAEVDGRAEHLQKRRIGNAVGTSGERSGRCGLDGKWRSGRLTLSLITCLLNDKKTAEAEALMNSLSIADFCCMPHIKAEYLSTEALLQEKLDHPDKAENAYKQAVETVDGVDYCSADWEQLMQRYSDFLEKQHRFDQASAIKKRILQEKRSPAPKRQPFKNLYSM